MAVKIAYNVEEAADAVGVSPNTIRAEIRDSRLAAKKRGSSVLIAADELTRWFDALPERV